MHRTILSNLQHYRPELRTIIPQTMYWQRPRQRGLGHLILCIDQSGSMMKCLTYAGIMASFLASIPSVQTHVIAYDTAVVDITDLIRDDPVQYLFGLQLGGGNDTAQALRYCSQLVERPEETILILLSDLMEGAMTKDMLAELAQLHRSGIRVLVLVSITEQGHEYHHGNARQIAARGIKVASCTPDRFAELLSELLNS